MCVYVYKHAYTYTCMSISIHLYAHIYSFFNIQFYYIFFPLPVNPLMPLPPAIITLLSMSVSPFLFAQSLHSLASPTTSCHLFCTHIYCIYISKKSKCIKKSFITLWARIKGKRSLWVKIYAGISVKNYDIYKNYMVYNLWPTISTNRRFTLNI